MKKIEELESIIVEKNKTIEQYKELVKDLQQKLQEVANDK